MVAAVMRRKGRGNDYARKRGGFQIAKRAAQGTRGTKPALFTSLGQSGTHHHCKNIKSQATSSHYFHLLHLVTSDKNHHYTLSPSFPHN
jgi:hypothetical protein